MKKWQVTIQLITGYDEFDMSPICKRVEFEVFAASASEAISKAKKLDISLLSVWESWADEIE